jgi:hypothetical protein
MDVRAPCEGRSAMGDQHDYADPADLAEQAASLGEADEELVVDETDPEVDDADRWEQATPVGGDEEEYRDT